MDKNTVKKKPQSLKKLSEKKKVSVDEYVNSIKDKLDSQSKVAVETKKNTKKVDSKNKLETSDEIIKKELEKLKILEDKKSKAKITAKQVVAGVAIAAVSAGAGVGGGFLLANSKNSNLIKENDKLKTELEDQKDLNQEYANQLAEAAKTIEAKQEIIDDLTIEKTAVESKLTEMQKCLASVQSELLKNEEEKQTLQNQLQNKETQLNEAKENVNSLNKTVEICNSQISSLQAEQAKLNTEKASLSEQIQQLETNAEVNSEEIARLNGELESVNNAITQKDTQIEKLITEKGNLQQELTTTQNSVSELETSISTLESQIIEKENTINNLSLKEETLNNQINELKSTNQNLESTISDLESQIDELKQESIQMSTAVSNFTFEEVVSEGTGTTSYAITSCANANLSEVIIPTWVSVDENGDIIAGTNYRVTHIAEDVFRDNSNLEYVIISNGIEYIGDNAFTNCSNLKSVFIPSSVKEIADGAFEGCENLEKVSILSIDAWMNTTFGGATANPLYYAENLYVNGELLTELNVSVFTTKINAWAFYNAKRLTKISFAEQTNENYINEIGEYAFAGCENLEQDLILPDLLCKLGEGAFQNCKKITSLVLSPELNDINKYTFDGCVNLSGNIVFLERNTTIHDSAFRNCAIESITINPEMTKIGDTGITENAPFYGCSSLNAVYVNDWYNQQADADVTALDIWMNIDFAYNYVQGDENTSSTFSSANPLVQAGNLYVNGELIQVIDLFELYNNGLTVKPAAFDGATGLTGVTGEVGSIGIGAFANCNLTYVSSVQASEIAPCAFYNSTINTMSFFENSTLRRYSLDGATITTVSFGGVSYISSYAFTHTTIINADLRATDNGGSSTLGVSTIADYAFYNCTTLQSVIMSDELTTIGKYAFAGCTNLSGNIEFKEGITTISEGAFSGCLSLEGVTLNEGLETIEDGAFKNCESITSVTIPSTVTKIGDTGRTENAPFVGCVNLNKVYSPSLDAWLNIDFAYHYVAGDETKAPEFSSANPLVQAHNLYINGELAKEIDFFDSETGNGTDITAAAFDGATCLESINVESCSIGFGAFANCNLDNVSCLDSVAPCAFYNSKCKYVSVFHQYGQLNSFVFTKCEVDSLLLEVTEYIASWSFAYSNVKNLTINMTNDIEIEAYAFYKSEQMETLTFAEDVNVIYVGENAFAGCDNLKEVNIPNMDISTISDVSSLNLPSCSNITNLNVYAKNVNSGTFNHVTIDNLLVEADTINSGAFNKTNITNLTLNAGTIKGCALSEVTIENLVIDAEKIESDVFIADSDSSIKNIVLNATTIEEGVIKFIDGVETITIGEKVDFSLSSDCMRGMNIGGEYIIIIDNANTAEFIYEAMYANAKEVYAKKDYTSEDYSYSVTNDGVIVVDLEYTGEYSDEYYKLIWDNPIHVEKDIIEEGEFNGYYQWELTVDATTIKKGAFNVSEIESVVINAETIESGAFEGANITYLTLNATTIEDGALNGISGVQVLTLGEKVESVNASDIGSRFNDYDTVVTLKIDSANALSEVWMYYSSTFDVYVNKSVISEDFKSDCGEYGIIVVDTSYTGEYSSEYYRLTWTDPVEDPEYVEEEIIEAGRFNGVTQENLTVNATTIKAGAFEGATITNLTLNATTIEEDALYGISGVQVLTLGEKVENVYVNDICNYFYGGDTVVTLKIDSANALSEVWMYYSSSTFDVYVNKSVISEDYKWDCGEDGIIVVDTAYSGEYSGEYYRLTWADPVEDPEYVEEEIIEAGRFNGVTQENLTVNATTIKAGAFEGATIENLTLNATTIEASALKGINGLKTITIGEKVENFEFENLSWYSDGITLKIDNQQFATGEIFEEIWKKESSINILVKENYIDMTFAYAPTDYDYFEPGTIFVTMDSEVAGYREVVSYVEY